ncbi:hypothetical protein KFK09_000384 [Dendrobium nobile]|uniref:Uncharacterized protein n=1 Tax=Dendrobium nobile TaxID=94219 RepID=A0A8T3CAZ5_DENNO|nr:hypothetical protein KFK09_000384 [Dendrobium nobile]
MAWQRLLTQVAKKQLGHQIFNELSGQPLFSLKKATAFIAKGSCCNQTKDSSRKVSFKLCW